MKDEEFTCTSHFSQDQQFSKAEKCMISEIITMCELLLENPANSAVGERLKTCLRSTTTQRRFSNLTIPNTHKQRTDKLCLIDVANEFAVSMTIEKATLAPSKNPT